MFTRSMNTDDLPYLHFYSPTSRFRWLVSICAWVRVLKLILMTLHVQGQVVGAREAAAAGDALEGFSPGVFPVVSGKFVRPGEAPVAVFPGTAVRLLTWRRDQERMGALATHVWSNMAKVVLNVSQPPAPYQVSNVKDRHT